MKKSNWFWGIFFLLSAVLVIVSQIGSFAEVGFISILATILLAALLIHSIFSRNFFGIFVPLAFLYMIYWKPLGWMNIAIWQLLAAAILLSIGFSILFRKRPGDYFPHTHDHKEFGSHSHDENGEYIPTVENMDDNNPSAKVSFGASNKYLHSDNLQSGWFSSSFGSLEVFFDQATLSPNGAEIYLDCSFGAIKLYVPRHWQVRDDIRATLGGVENDTRFAKIDKDSPILTLTGNVTLGGIEIQYV